MVLADKAYSSRAIREHLRKRGIRAVTPVPADQRSHRLRRGSLGGRSPAFDRETYKQRNTVERCINRLKQWRGIATRYEKTATIYPPDSTSRATSPGPPADPTKPPTARDQGGM
ncbi:hypothetical protein SGLAU_00305 [Streptomyces glaucescens]|uniref:Transposase IS4-like domain-containing protein n=1 Tax=Streptomyces glaucescens TaxID=1907 RepID=A0A089X4V5_STRGA|nr:hypothetical protein SGLAU_00305 [Streptomyces glaucescens]